MWQELWGGGTEITKGEYSLKKFIIPILEIYYFLIRNEPSQELWV